MEDKISRDKNKIKVFSSLLIIVLLVMGVSFAIFQNFARQSGTNNLGATNCFSVTFEGVNNAINLANDYPIPDSEGLERDPYTFKVTNNCNQYLSLSIGVETLSTSEIPSNLIKGVIVKNGGIPTSAMLLSSGKTMEAQNGGTAYELLTDGLGAKASKTYDLRLWFDESMTKEQGASKTYKGKVIVASSADMEKPRLLNQAILADNKVKTPLTTPGVSVSAYTVNDVTRTSSNVDSNGFYRKYYITYGTGWEKNGTKFNLTGVSVTSEVYEDSYASLVGKFLPAHTIGSSGSSTAGETVNTTDLNYVYYVVGATSMMISYKIIASNENQSEALLASTEDDYGTSYYFRGLVTNNYVEFANKCWRIVRIGGDNTVKLILHNDNTEKIFNPCSSANNSTTAAFAHYNGSKYTSSFNYNYEDNAGVGFMYGESGSSTYEETHANTNKSRILTNLETWYSNNLNDYESVIDDNVFCNDKTLFSGDGYGTIATKYGAYGRLVSNKTPSLKCASELSKIATKIGLITADEAAYAGYSAFVSSSLNYLEENAADGEWWTLSPSQKDGFGPSVWIVDGKFGELDENGTSETARVRPYISLKSSTKVTGEGTSENPYKSAS